MKGKNHTLDLNNIEPALKRLPTYDLKARGAVQSNYEVELRQKRNRALSMIKQFDVEKDFYTKQIKTSFSSSKVKSKKLVKFSTGDNWYIP